MFLAYDLLNYVWSVNTSVYLTLCSLAVTVKYFSFNVLLYITSNHKNGNGGAHPYKKDVTAVITRSQQRWYHLATCKLVKIHINFLVIFDIYTHTQSYWQTTVSLVLQQELFSQAANIKTVTIMHQTRIVTYNTKITHYTLSLLTK